MYICELLRNYFVYQKISGMHLTINENYIKSIFLINHTKPHCHTGQPHQCNAKLLCSTHQQHCPAAAAEQ